jgi:hypothetical protein
MIVALSQHNTTLLHHNLQSKNLVKRGSQSARPSSGENDETRSDKVGVSSHRPICLFYFD